MSQVLTVCQVGREWAARDVTGANYGQSSDLLEASEAAERLARKLGARVNLSREAQNHLLTQQVREPKIK